MELQDQVHGLSEDSRDLDSAHSTKAHSQAVPLSPLRMALDGQARSATGQPALVPPSRQSSPAIPPSDVTGSAQQPPFSGRLPSTPPLSRPPKFLTRPYRRTTDGHHTHLHPFGSGSTSSGVRSAFKDFVVPAQIILLCSILNATWPLLTNAVMTILEFLALVFASYFACARRSEDCYFLEPVSHSRDGREGTIYVATIHWTLRALLIVGVVSIVMFVGTQLTKLWRLVFAKEEHLRAKYALELDSLTISTNNTSLPSSRSYFFSWIPIIRRFSRSKPESSRPPRSRTSSSSSSTSSWWPSKTNLQASPSSLEAAQSSRPTKSFSPAPLDSSSSPSSSSKPHKTKSKAGKKSASQPSTDNVHIAGSDVQQLSKKNDAERSQSTSSLDTDTPAIEQNHEDFEDKDDTETTNESNDKCLRDHIVTLSQTIPTKKISCNEPAKPASGEPTAVVQLDSTLVASNDSEPSTAVNIEISPTTKDSPQIVDDDSDFISPHEKRRRRKAKTLKANRTAASTTMTTEPEPCPKLGREDLPKNGDSSDIVKQEKTSKSSKSVVLSNEKTEPQLSSTVSRDATKSGTKDRVTFASDTPLSPKQPTPVHPLHALNSTSTIVWTKASHKRSQSAQLPPTMPWNQVALNSQGSGPRSASPHIQATTTTTKTSLQENTKSSGDNLGQRRASAQTGPDATKASSVDTNVHRWYSPFQSGLDITIDGENETEAASGSQGDQTGDHISGNSASQASAAGSKPGMTKLKLPPFLATPSSFFESSPRTPRIMPFSQNQQQHLHPYGALAGVNMEDSWTRTRSSSIGAPLTPQMDTTDPFDFGSGSRSAGCSRRNSIESNLMESLLSGKTRMFGDLENDATLNSHPTSIQLTSPLGSSTTSTSSPLVALDFLSTMDSTLTPLQVEKLPETTPVPTTFESHDSDIPVFVNPWDTDHQYAPVSTNPTAYLSSALLTPSQYSPVVSSSSIDPATTARQASLLRAMNSGSIGGSTLANSPMVNPMATVTEPDLSVAPGLVSSSRPGTSLLRSIPMFGPYPSVEMSLAAEVNKPPPLREIPLDDSFEKLSMEEVMKKKTGQEKKKSHRRTGSNTNNNHHHHHHHQQHGGSGGGHGSEHEDSKKSVSSKGGHPQRTARAGGSGRSGHNKTTSLGSFLPPLPPPSSDKGNTSSASTGDKKDSLLSLTKPSARDTHSQNRDETSSKGGEHHASRRTKQSSTASAASGRDVASSKSLNKTRV
ncbi:hypothetical protein BGW41_003947 [Actinomortierella wolfii]|nr:hypothetical protein BGW41_003947 [Actinomortierella wolfii]